MSDAPVPDHAERPRPLRLFIALTPATVVQQALAELAAPLLAAVAGAARPVPPHALHLTLRFLGDTAAARIPALRDALADAAAASAPLRLAVAGAGAFPSRARAQVLWLGLADDPELRALVARVEAACDSCGFGREGRTFRAHLTVARVHRGRRVAEDLLAPALDSIGPGPRFSINTLDLVASTLTHAGAHHEPVARLPLGAAGADPAECSRP